MGDNSNGSAPAAPPATPGNVRALVQHNLRQASASADTGGASANADTGLPRAGRGVQAPPAAAADPGDTELEGGLGDATEGDTELDAADVQDAVEDLLEADLHGHKGRAILEAIKAGNLPPELMAALKATAKVNGQEIPVTLQEALNGYMRTSDYARGKKALKDERAQMNGRLSAVQGMLESWSDGKALRQGLKRLGKHQAFHDAAVEYAREQHREFTLQQQNPAAYQEMMRARELAERLEAMEQQNRRQSQMAQQPQNGPQEQQLIAQLEQLVAPTFGELGIKETPFARERFAEHFRVLFDEDADLATNVRAAAQATAEELGDLAERHAKSLAGNGGSPKATPPPARPQAAPAAARAPVPRRMTPAQMQEHLAKRRAESRGR